MMEQVAVRWGDPVYLPQCGDGALK
jgi:hypothetical protein